MLAAGLLVCSPAHKVVCPCPSARARPPVACPCHISLKFRHCKTRAWTFRLSVKLFCQKGSLTSRGHARTNGGRGEMLGYFRGCVGQPRPQYLSLVMGHCGPLGIAALEVGLRRWVWLSVLLLRQDTFAVSRAWVEASGRPWDSRISMSLSFLYGALQVRGQ